MDTIVQKVGRKNNCTFCGVFRRQALDRGAVMMGVDKIVTGHNADDIAETIVMNILRGDVARLNRCCAVQTGSEGSLSRSKPFKYTYEKEIVMYAYFKKLDYFSTECIYSPNAYRGHARAYIKDLEKIRPSAIIDIIHSGECLSIKEGVKMATMSLCTRCGHISSQAVCKACVLLEGLNKGRPRLGVGKSSKVTARMKINPMDLVGELPPSSESADGDKHTNFSEERNASVAELAVASQLENVAETEPSKTSQPDEGSPTVNHLTVDLLASSLTECTVSSSCNGSTLIDERSHKKEIFINVRNTSAVTPVIREKANIKNCIEEIEDSNMDSNLVISENQSISEHSSVTKIGKSLPVRRVFSPRKKEQISQNGATVDDFTSSESQPGNKCSSQATSIEDIGNNAGGKVCESGGQCSGNCEKKTEKARKVVSLKHNPESPLKTAGISKKDIEF
uniref:Cytoplasmic tRNA 2-thiolation protein 1-like n=1 Tax=Hirondellea gigas TaxID=1518452 RepID=A0A2P2I4B0_9CRUS